VMPSSPVNRDRIATESLREALSPTAT